MRPKKKLHSATMPPRGTAQKQKHLQRKPPRDFPTRQTLTDEDLKGLDEAIGKQFGWERGPWPHQMQGIKAQLQGKNALMHAGTGSGKTGIAAGPHVHPSSKGKVTIMVSPLIALHEEQVSDLNNNKTKEN